MDLSIVLPAHNEEEVIEDAVRGLQDWVEGSGRTAEIIIVEDGCTDSTPEIAERLSGEESVRHLHYDGRLGKGAALEEGFEASGGELLCFMDADMSTSLEDLESLIEPLEGDEADIVIGSRYVRGSDARRSPGRDILSRSYNVFASRVLGTGISDHQCGFKAFRRDAFEALGIEARGWFWDTEMLYRARERGLRLKEVPVRWDRRSDSGVGIFKVSAELVKGVVDLKGEEVLGERYDNVEQFGRFAVVGGTGALINTAVLYTLTEFLGLFYMLSSVFAIEAAIVSMFFMNNRFTFQRTKRGTSEILDGILRSNVIRSLGIAISLGLLYTLTEFLNLFYLVSNIVAIAVAAVANFVLEKRFNWKEKF